MMTPSSRRLFLKRSVVLGALSLLPRAVSLAAPTPPRNRLGLFVSLDGKEPDEALEPVKQLGFGCCEVYRNSFSDAYAAKLRGALARLDLQATALFASGPGPQVYDFYQGPETIGLVPRPFRSARVAALKQASDFAKLCGIPAFETHCGFIPENPNDPLYEESVEAIREVAGHCRNNGQTFLYHAGQETPVTLLRTIQDVGLDNQGVGLDTANLILCGKGHPLAALEVFGRHLKAVNAKDGLYPTDAKHLGKETPLGRGKVDFPHLLRRLKVLGYAAPIIIEREIDGPQFREDVQRGRLYLEKLLKELG
ncbi:MAG: sugar phosphate isomerase/epimerase family protein [Verrucomicrobiota bacterium]